MPDSSTILVAKREMRARYLARRSLIEPSTRQQASLAIATRLFQLKVWREASGIHCFISLPAEIDTAPIWQEATLDKACFAPVQMPDQSLAATAWRPGEPLSKGAFLVSEPLPPAAGHQLLSPAQANAISLVIVPGIAFDKNRQRLGFGKGIYDRFISRLQALKDQPATLIGLAMEWQCQQGIPTEPHDIPMDIVITPSFTLT